MSGLDRPKDDPHRAIAPTYAARSGGDPRIARRIREALGDARSVVNVGAGTGPYESLPMPARSVDAAMACLTLHQWGDWRVGMQELRRVARKRIVVFTYDPSRATSFWLMRDYLPQLARIDAQRFPTLAEQCAAAGERVSVSVVPIPHDCEDDFLGAYWRRPDAYLDPHVRASMPTFRLPGAERAQPGLQRLADDLRSGRWRERYRDLLELEELDLGYRLVVAELCDVWSPL